MGAGLFLVLAGGGLLKDMQARAASLTRGERPLAARVAAMRGTIGDKVALFYPTLDKDYRLVAGLSNRTGAAHVLVTYPMFRFFERGAHALSLWPFERVQPGDLFASHEYHTPPPDPREFNPELPALLVQVIARCLQKDPAERFQSTREISALVKEALARSARRAPAT